MKLLNNLVGWLIIPAFLSRPKPPDNFVGCLLVFVGKLSALSTHPKPGRIGPVLPDEEAGQHSFDTA
jgi:hypothetical protein